MKLKMESILSFRVIQNTTFNIYDSIESREEINMKIKLKKDINFRSRNIGYRGTYIYNI